MLLWPFNKYPGSDLETYNWHWILETVKYWSQEMAQIKQAITDFMNSGFRDDVEEILTSHPEWTTTVQDRSLELIKLTEHAEYMAENNYVNVKDYGAIGDGITDDTAAIQAAINDANAVYFPAGIYKVSQTLHVTDSKYLFGDTITSSVDNTGAQIIGELHDVISIEARGCVLKNLYIKLSDNYTLPQAQNYAGIRIDFVDSDESAFVLDNVSVKLYGFGIHTSHAYMMRITNCRALNCKVGFYHENATTITWTNCWALAATDKGYELFHVNYSSMRSCAADACNISYYIHSSLNVSLYTCGSEVSLDVPVQITDSETILIDGFYSYNNNSTGTERYSTSKVVNSKCTSFRNCYEPRVNYQGGNPTASIHCDDTSYTFIEGCLLKISPDGKHLYGTYRNDTNDLMLTLQEMPFKTNDITVDASSVLTTSVKVDEFNIDRVYVNNADGILAIPFRSGSFWRVKVLRASDMSAITQGTNYKLTIYRHPLEEY